MKRTLGFSLVLAVFAAFGIIESGFTQSQSQELAS